MSESRDVSISVYISMTKLLYLDNIILSYYNLYKNRKLVGYKKLSFKVLEQIAKIAKRYVNSYIDMVA